MNFNLNWVWKVGRIFFKDLTQMIYLTFFLNIYLKIFYACFTKRKLNSTHRYNPWIKVKVLPIQATKAFRVGRGIALPHFKTSELKLGWGVSTTPRPLYPQDNPWITRGIKVTCHNKGILYMSCRGSNDTNFKLWYKRYWNILTDVKKSKKKIVLWWINIQI